MDSLIANYASGSEEEEEEEKGTEFNQSWRASLVSSSPPVPKGEFNPYSSSSIFTALPPPKNNNSYLPLPSPSPSLKPQQDDLPKTAASSLFSSLPPAKARSGFSLPPPKNKSGKRVVEFKPPLNPALLENLDEDEKYERPSKKRAISDGSETLVGGLTALLPPPKNDNLLGAGGGAHTGRRFFVETAPSTYPPPDAYTNVMEEPSLDLHHSFHSYSGGAITPAQNEYYYSADPPSQGVDFGSSGGCSHGNQYPQPCSPQEAAYVQGNELTKGAHQVSESAGSSFGKVEERSFGKVEERKRGRNQIPSNVIEVKQDELMGNRPREDQAKLTGIAFGPSYQPVSSGKDKPTKLHKRKHQIGSLYFDLRQKEMELAERRARGQLTKAETQAKYGW